MITDPKLRYKPGRSKSRDRVGNEKQHNKKAAKKRNKAYLRMRREGANFDPQELFTTRLKEAK